MRSRIAKADARAPKETRRAVDANPAGREFVAHQRLETALPGPVLPPTRPRAADAVPELGRNGLGRLVPSDRCDASALVGYVPAEVQIDERRTGQQLRLVPTTGQPATVAVVESEVRPTGQRLRQWHRRV